MQQNSVLDSHGADMFQMVPDVIARLNTVERTVIPQMQARMAEQQAHIDEMRRMVGDENAFSLKARRARAPDEEQGAAASGAPSFPTGLGL